MRKRVHFMNQKIGKLLVPSMPLADLDFETPNEDFAKLLAVQARQNQILSAGVRSQN